MSKSISRRNFLKYAALGAAGGAALTVTGCSNQTAAASSTASSAPAESAASSAVQSTVSAEPVFKTPQQMLTQTLNPQKCDIFTTRDAPDLAKSKIFEPWQLGKYTIENRIVKSAAGSAYLASETKENVIEEYTNWAKGGAKLIWIEDFINLYRDFPAHYKAYSRVDSYLKELTDSMHAEGCVCGYQLSLMGASFSGFDATTAAEFECAHADHMTYEELKNLQDNFIDAAQYLKEQGVDAIEINAAGNNINQAFLSRNRNARTDEYGTQTFENRTRFLSELIKGIKAVNGADYPVQVLINGIEENDKDIGQNAQLTTLEETCEIAKRIEAAGADALHVRLGPFGKHVAEFASDLYFTGFGIAGTTGFGTQFDFSRHFQGKLATENSGCGMMLPVAQAIKNCVSIPVGTVTFMDPARAPKYFVDALDNGMCDFLLMTRPMIAEPEYINKLKENRLDEIRPCNRCMHCHFDYDEQGNFNEHCRVNATHMRAWHGDVMPEGRTPLPAQTVKKVVVVGGGPAGMEAAAVAAKRGHKVTLVEKNGYLGGLLPFASAVKGPHENLDNLRKYLARQLEVNGVEVITGQTADAQSIKAMNPDAVILAVGGKRETLDLDETGATNIISIDDVAWADIGEEVVVVGGNAQAVDVTLYLQAQGKHVTIVTPDSSDALGKGQSSWVKTFTNPMIYARGTRVWQGAHLIGVGNGEVTFTCETGVDMTVKCDTVIEAMDMVPNTELLAELDGIETYAVGDCDKPFNIAEAIAAGHIAARKV